jgi:hypothetical protein
VVINITSFDNTVEVMCPNIVYNEFATAGESNRTQSAVDSECLIAFHGGRKVLRVTAAVCNFAVAMFDTVGTFLYETKADVRAAPDENMVLAVFRSFRPNGLREFVEDALDEGLIVHCKYRTAKFVVD